VVLIAHHRDPNPGLLGAHAEDAGPALRKDLDLDIVAADTQTIERRANRLLGGAGVDLDAVVFYAHFPFLLRLEELRRRIEEGEGPRGGGVTACEELPPEVAGGGGVPRNGRLPQPTVKRCCTML